ncbi:MAG: Nucleoside-diphosphate-sugar epimerase [Frondihabitans sp.]|nr:Nucleoside-diphosphate-sugar epimerase [Frondihabitans sp.]
MSTRVLFLGGAGMIGSAAAREAVRQGIDLTIVTRNEPTRSIPEEVTQVRGDVRQVSELERITKGQRYDAVVNWIGFSPKDLDGHAALFREITGQYVFISTCSVFGRPVPQLPITESSPRKQPVFQYAREKIECEDLLEVAYREEGLPLTIVRPFHTYDETVLPVLSGWTAVDRLRSGRGVIVHGDGTSLWSLTHSSDFARAFVPLLGDQHAVGESVNVVSGDITTWDQIHLELAAAAGVRDPKLVHRSSESIATEIPGWGEVLQEDFRHSMLFDTTKLKRLVPDFAPRVSLSQGLREAVEYFEADESRQQIDETLSAAFDRLIEKD